MIIELTSDSVLKLTKTELEIIKYINENEEQLSELSIVDIGFNTYSSPSTVSRAIRKCGLSGFNELRYRSAVKGEDRELFNISEIMNKSLIEAQRVIEQISLTKVLDIIKCLNKARNIVVFARGLTSYVGQEFALKLQLLGYFVFFTDDPNIMKIKSKQLKVDEVLFIFSLYGGTPELIQAAENAFYNDIDVITCCCNENSKLLEYTKYAVIGYKHAHQAIKEFEVSSRIPLSMISRIIIDHISTYESKGEQKLYIK